MTGSFGGAGLAAAPATSAQQRWLDQDDIFRSIDYLF